MNLIWWGCGMGSWGGVLLGMGRGPAGQQSAQLEVSSSDSKYQHIMGWSGWDDSVCIWPCVNGQRNNSWWRFSFIIVRVRPWGFFIVWYVTSTKQCSENFIKKTSSYFHVLPDYTCYIDCTVCTKIKITIKLLMMQVTEGGGGGVLECGVPC